MIGVVLACLLFVITELSCSTHYLFADADERALPRAHSHTHEIIEHTHELLDRVDGQ